MIYLADGHDRRREGSFPRRPTIVVEGGKVIKLERVKGVVMRSM